MKSRTASDAIKMCGAARARPATRLGSSAIGAKRPTRAPLRSNTGPPLALLSTAAVTTGVRLASGKRGRACRKALSGEPKDEQILRRRSKPGRFAVRGEISGEHRETRRRVGALDRTGLPPTVGFGQSSP